MREDKSAMSMLLSEGIKVDLGPDDFCAFWRGYEFHVWRDRSWYIIVKHPDGGYLYDGLWAESGDKTVEEAVEEAFRGAQLTEAT
jgi:hypothetical protein